MSRTPELRWQALGVTEEELLVYRDSDHRTTARQLRRAPRSVFSPLKLDLTCSARVPAVKARGTARRRDATHGRLYRPYRTCCPNRPYRRGPRQLSSSPNRPYRRGPRQGALRL